MAGQILRGGFMVGSIDPGSNTSDLLEAGREALQRHAWQEAYDLLSRADSADVLPPEDLQGLAESAWWIGHIDDCIDAREKAYAIYVDRGNRRQAASMAVGLADNYFWKGRSSVGNGWLSRAERLLEDEPESLEHGYLARLQGVRSLEATGDLERALKLAERASELALRLGDRDLQALGLHDRGRILVTKGEVEEGMALMEEAMVAAVGGELSPLPTGKIYCNMIDTCEALADHRRAAEWDEAARRWCERVGHRSGFPGICRVHRAEIIRLRGAWTQAEQEARRACAELRDFPPLAGQGFERIGEIRLQMGDLGGAEEAFRQAHRLGGDPQPGLALLRLSQGKQEAARSLIDQALADDSRNALDRARLLPAQVEIALAGGDLEAARSGIEELRSVAREYGSQVLEAATAYAQGTLLIARGDLEPAVEELRKAYRLWSENELPYETARARLMLGTAYRQQGADELSGLELEAASDAFEKLGAIPEQRRAAELLEGQGPAPYPRGERVIKTLMFTDIVGSTRLIEAAGDEAWTLLVSWHDQTLRSLFAEHGGQEIDHAGDGFFVAFDDPPTAVECAVRIQRTLEEHRRTHGFAPEVRIGVHRAETSRVGTSYKGKEVHKAARIAALAQGGEILVTTDIADHLPSGLSLSESRTVNLKDIAEPVDVVSVSW
ncbi:MAG: adenylate/guanylate cyclase domain-containing protein [Acidimicrobiia bacterium]